jgi:hypothetical protein
VYDLEEVLHFDQLTDLGTHKRTISVIAIYLARSRNLEDAVQKYRVDVTRQSALSQQARVVQKAKKDQPYLNEAAKTWRNTGINMQQFAKLHGVRGAESLTLMAAKDAEAAAAAALNKIGNGSEHNAERVTAQADLDVAQEKVVTAEAAIEAKMSARSAGWAVDQGDWLTQAAHNWRSSFATPNATTSAHPDVGARGSVKVRR